MVSRRHGAGRFPGVAMNQYLISIYQPDGPPPASIEIHRIMLEVHALRDEMKQAGAWVFSGGLHDASTATVVQVAMIAVSFMPSSSTPNVRAV